MTLTHAEVMHRLCLLVSTVGNLHFHSQVPHDCFCGDAKVPPDEQRIDGRIVEFITRAVRTELERDPMTVTVVSGPDTREFPTYAAAYHARTGNCAAVFRRGVLVKVAGEPWPDPETMDRRRV